MEGKKKYPAKKAGVKAKPILVPKGVRPTERQAAEAGFCAACAAHWGKEGRAAVDSCHAMNVVPGLCPRTDIITTTKTP